LHHCGIESPFPGVPLFTSAAQTFLRKPAYAAENWQPACDAAQHSMRLRVSDPGWRYQWGTYWYCSFAHRAMGQGHDLILKIGLLLTILLGITFLGLQANEYIDNYNRNNLTLNAGIYGSIFYLLTGFHGFHVLVGVVMISTLLGRAMKGHFACPGDHFAIEGVAWYWHFVPKTGRMGYDAGNGGSRYKEDAYENPKIGLQTDLIKGLSHENKSPCSSMCISISKYYSFCNSR
jgi:hypothetical protein